MPIGLIKTCQLTPCFVIITPLDAATISKYSSSISSIGADGFLTKRIDAEKKKKYIFINDEDDDDHDDVFDCEINEEESKSSYIKNIGEKISSKPPTGSINCRMKSNKIIQIIASDSSEEDLTNDENEAKNKSPDTQLDNDATKKLKDTISSSDDSQKETEKYKKKIVISAENEKFKRTIESDMAKLKKSFTEEEKKTTCEKLRAGELKSTASDEDEYEFTKQPNHVKSSTSNTPLIKAKPPLHISTLKGTNIFSPKTNVQRKTILIPPNSPNSKLDYF